MYEVCKCINNENNIKHEYTHVLYEWLYYSLYPVPAYGKWKYVILLAFV